MPKPNPFENLTVNQVKDLLVQLPDPRSWYYKYGDNSLFYAEYRYNCPSEVRMIEEGDYPAKYIATETFRFRVVIDEDGYFDWELV